MLYSVWSSVGQHSNFINYDQKRSNKVSKEENVLVTKLCFIVNGRQSSPIWTGLKNITFVLIIITKPSLSKLDDSSKKGLLESPNLESRLRKSLNV